MTDRRDDPAAEPLDRPLREALRHAPDAGLGAPPALGEAILQRARAALDAERRAAAPRQATARRDKTKGAAAQPGRFAITPTGLRAVFGAAWDWLARPPVAAAMASVLVATTLGLLWRDGLMDDPFVDLPSPAPTAAPTAAPTPPAAGTPAAPLAAPTAAAPPTQNGRLATQEPPMATAPAPAGPAAATDAEAPTRAAQRLREAGERPQSSAAPPGPTSEAPVGGTRPRAPETAPPPPALKTAPMATAPAPAPAPAPAAAVPVPMPAVPPAFRAPVDPPASPATPAHASPPAAAPIPVPPPAPVAPPLSAPPPALPAPMVMAPPPAPAPAAPRPLPPATTGASRQAPAAAAEAGPAAPTGQATTAVPPGDVDLARRGAPMVRFSAPAASEGPGTAGRSDGAARLEASVVPSHDAELAGLARSLRSEGSRWALRTAGGEARAAADPAAAWIDALRHEATVADGRWTPAGPADAVSPAATLTLLRDGQRRHHFVLTNGRVVWESGTGAVRTLTLSPQAMQRLVDRLP